MNKMHKFFLNQCAEWASLSTCKRMKVGCVITRDDRVITTGVNGTLPGECNKCEGDDGKTLPGVIHAEQNAIYYAAKKGIVLEGCTLYCEWSPCAMCASAIIQAGITKVVYARKYKRQAPVEKLRALNVEVIYAGI